MASGVTPSPAGPSGTTAIRWRTAGLAWAGGVVLALCLYRSGPRLGFDSYYYCEFAKLFARAWPDAFGNHWPCGYPLLGGLLGRLGMTAYPALTLVSLAGLAALVAIASKFAPNPLLVCAMAAAPIIGVQAFGVATELPFAAAFLGMAAALAAWPRTPAIWAAAGCAVIALSLRYAGVIAFGVLAIWLVGGAPALRTAGKLRQAALAVASATLIAAGLLLWNLAATGHLSGAYRGSPAGLGWNSWPGHLADLGWSLPSALMLGGLRDRIGSGWPVQGIGWALSIGGGLFCSWAAMRPRQPWVRPCAGVALAYGIGLVFLRSVGSFDALYGARTFLPVIFPIGLVLAGQFHDRRPWIARGLAAAVLVLGVASAARGLSQQISGDVRPAASVLKGRLRVDDAVQVNDWARSLSAFIPQQTNLAWPEYLQQGPQQRFLVVAARPVDRSGMPGEIEPAWLSLCAGLVSRGTHRWLLKTPAVIVLERVEPPAPR